MGTLAQQFPELSFAKEADDWLAAVPRKSMREQLSERKIRAIVFVKIKPLGIFSIFGDGFLIQIKKRIGNKQRILTLGHEIAHTIEAEALEFPCWKKQGKLIERFCESFAARWLALNGRKKVSKFFREKRRNKRALSHLS